MHLGLTGGIGCGKSTAGKLLEKHGFKRLDSDQIVKDLLASDKELIESIISHFGESVRLPDAGINRTALAGLVFNDLEKLRWLENLLHPRVGAIWRNALKANPASNFVVEIPLLFEKNLEKAFDFSVCVMSSETKQLHRLAQKNISEKQARARMERQLPLSDKVSKSDIVLYNQGNIAFLESQIQRLCTLA